MVWNSSAAKVCCHVHLNAVITTIQTYHTSSRTAWHILQFQSDDAGSLVTQSPCIPLIDMGLCKKKLRVHMTG